MSAARRSPVGSALRRATACALPWAFALGAVRPAAAQPPAAAQLPKPAPNTAPILASLDQTAPRYADIARRIWSFAEVGYQETRSSALLQQTLRDAGFRVTAGIVGEPTAFVAEYGSGTPVIAILGEFDALPGLSQDTVPERRALQPGGPGHGCGHNLFGTASTAAAIALKAWMQANGVKGTLRMIGTPAEEGGAGKVFMVRDGVFDDVDAAIVWHPNDAHEVNLSASKANINGKFRFRGLASHASTAPERGRSALDAVEAMDVMVNMLREHVPDGTRLHYVITKGGTAPNVVPDEAEVYHYVRHEDMRVVKDVWSRVVDAAKGAALGTGTTVQVELVGSVYSYNANRTLAAVMQRALERVGGYQYTDAERAFARRLQASDRFTAVPLETVERIQPLHVSEATAGSTDVGDVSWVVPTIELNTATYVPGTAAHTWQSAATAGMSIGAKGMMVAAKTMALTAADLFVAPTVLQAARAELKARQGPDFRYKTALGDQKPPLDYRKGSVP